MGRQKRITPAGYVYHIMNRGVFHTELFSDYSDYLCFHTSFRELLLEFPISCLAFCYMPSYWDLILWPREDDIIPPFMQRLTSTHVRRWRMRWGAAGGHLYQGRYKCEAVSTEQSVERLKSLIETNPVRANLVSHPEEWKWSSAWERENQMSSLDWETSARFGFLSPSSRVKLIWDKTA